MKFIVQSGARVTVYAVGVREIEADSEAEAVDMAVDQIVQQAEVYSHTVQVKAEKEKPNG